MLADTLRGKAERAGDLRWDLPGEPIEYPVTRL